MLKHNLPPPVRVVRLHDQDTQDDLCNTTPEQRLGMMWQLAVDAWAFMGDSLDDSRLQRDVVRVVRRNG
jgi:hypothetical protein